MGMTTLDIETKDDGKHRKKQTRTIYILIAAIAILLALVITFAVLYAKKDTSSDDSSSKSSAANNHGMKATTASTHPSIAHPPSTTLKAGTTSATTNPSTTKPDMPTTTLKPVTTEATTNANATKPNMPTTTLKPVTTEVCNTTACEEAAELMMSRMDERAKPCKDFNQYACGKFLDSAVIAGYSKSNGSFDYAGRNNVQRFQDLLEAPIMSNYSFEYKMKTMYNACLDEDAIDTHGLDAYNKGNFSQDWPTLNTKWDKSTFTLQSVINKYAGLLTDVLFTSYPTLDGKRKEDRYTLAIAQGNFLLSKDELLKARDDPKIQAYEKYYTDLAVALDANMTDAKKDAKDVVDFHIALAKLMLDPEDYMNISVTRNPTTLGEMNNKYGYLNWLEMFQKMYDNINMKIESTQQVNIDTLDYIRNLGDVLNKTDHRTIQNTFGFMQAKKMAAMAKKELRGIWLQFRKARDGVQEERDRTEYCANEIDGLYNVGMAKLVSELAFTKKAERFMDTLIHNLKAAYHANIEKIGWMTSDTKTNAFKKLEAMDYKIGVPKAEFNGTDIDELYQNFNVSKTNYITDQLQNDRQNQLHELRKLGKLVVRTRWGSSITTVNAFNNPDRNEIVFPLGILQPPFFGQDRPSYLNYGAIGHVIGHEIGHSFDTEGRQHDAKGLLNDWWTHKDAAGYDERAQCFIDQYNGFKVTLEGKTYPANGKLTVTENVADNLGLKAAYEAYMMFEKTQTVPELPLPLPENHRLTNHQLFFVSLAQDWCEKYRTKALISNIANDPHSIAKDRIIGPLQNSEEFAKAFECTAGDYMDPVKKCTLW